VHDVVNSNLVKLKFADMGLRVILDSTPDSFRAYLNGEIERWHHFIVTNNIPVPPT